MIVDHITTAHELDNNIQTSFLLKNPIPSPIVSIKIEIFEKLHLKCIFIDIQYDSGNCLYAMLDPLLHWP